MSRLFDEHGGPMYSCSNDMCAEIVSFPPEDLLVRPDGKLTCEVCWDEDRGGNDPEVSELKSFVPEFQNRIAELEAQLAEVARLAREIVCGKHYEAKHALIDCASWNKLSKVFCTNCTTRHQLLKLCGETE